MPGLDDFEQWGKFVTIAIGYFGAVSAVAVAGWRYGRSIARGLRIVDALHARYGENPLDHFEAALRRAHVDLGLQRILHDVAAERLGIAVYFCDEKGHCIFANEPLCEIFGLDSTEMLGLGWLAAIAESERMAIHAAWLGSVNAGVPFRTEYTVENQKRGTSKRYTTETRAAVVSGQVVAFAGIVRPQNGDNR